VDVGFGAVEGVDSGVAICVSLELAVGVEEGDVG
jgi:hypothetical protein